MYPREAASDEPAFDGRDALLIVGVGRSTAWSDRSKKLPGYAIGEIEEVWLVVPDLGLLSCHRSPHHGRFTDERELAWPDGLPTLAEQLATRLRAE